MNELDELITAVENFEQQKDRILLALFKDRESLATSLNVDRQLFKEGVDSNGVELIPPYADSTVARKKRKGDPYDHVTLRDEGDFHRSIEFDYREDEVAFVSFDSKYFYLSEKYGDAILGLTLESISLLAQNMKEDLISEARKMILT